MRYMGLNEVREKFLSFFESKDHLRLKSAPLIPQNDKSLLLINSGMAPLKPYFTGRETPPSPRATTCQKCVRTNDIDNVGYTMRHGSFFEMLGNFSFGDYFKNEAIEWGWEFCVKVLELPPERLFASVYFEDDESYEIWNKKIGLPPEKIFKFGKEDNFWEVGLGPCGPCSEIYFDKGEKYGCGKHSCSVGCDCDRYVEIWNLVFTQFNKEEDGSYSKLASANIDTGMGLERVASAMQDVNSIFDVDTIKAIRDKICEIAGKNYGENTDDDVSIRIITDHARAFTFMLSDGVLPSNAGRGYVLRRLLRRALRRGRSLGITELFLARVAAVVIENSKDAYPELSEQQEYIFKTIDVEEQNFYKKLDQGAALLQDLIDAAKNSENKIAGGDAFRLYDTYGFPIELVKEILSEVKMSFDEEEFNEKMREQKERARLARAEYDYMGTEENAFVRLGAEVKTQFFGYDTLRLDDAKILAISQNDSDSKQNLLQEAEEGAEIAILLDKTPFYAQSGGQIGDAGVIKTSTGEAEVIDTIKIMGGKISHIARVTLGTLKVNQTADAEVNSKRRLNTARNHTATHLLHKALAETLGAHVKQGGSAVSDDRLRFDFTHFAALTEDEIKKIEKIVNQKILENIPATIQILPVEEAKKTGAVALFGEKYGDFARVLSIGDYSKEFCGGTHVGATSIIGIFKIVSEGSVGSGLRRIEALTGEAAHKFFFAQNERVNNASRLLKIPPEKIPERIKLFLDETKALRKTLESAKSQSPALEDALNKKVNIKGVNFVAYNFGSQDANSLKTLGDRVKDKLDPCVVVLASVSSGKVNLAATASRGALEKGADCGALIKKIAPIVNGAGGGRPNMAQAGGTGAANIEDALNAAKDWLEANI